MMSQKQSFWVTNICNRNVSLADLNLTIKSFSSVNLLDNKHYSYTSQQLIESALKGSLFKKRDKIVVRSLAPEVIRDNLVISDNAIPTRQRSILSIKEEDYEELNISDEQFAKESAEIETSDNK